MSLALLAICALSAYRIWRLLAKDTLPVLERVRAWAAKRWLAQAQESAMNAWLSGEPNDPRPNVESSPWFEALTCPWCLGSLISFAVVAAVAQVISIPLPGLFALATATLVGLIGNFDS